MRATAWRGQPAEVNPERLNRICTTYMPLDHAREHNGTAVASSRTHNDWLANATHEYTTMICFCGTAPDSIQSDNTHIATLEGKDGRRGRLTDDPPALQSSSSASRQYSAGAECVVMRWMHTH
jgi:hypothetical protein